MNIHAVDKPHTHSIIMVLVNVMIIDDTGKPHDH